MRFWKTFAASGLATLVVGVVLLVMGFGIFAAMISGIGSSFEPKKVVLKKRSVLKIQLKNHDRDFYANLTYNLQQSSLLLDINYLIDLLFQGLKLYFSTYFFNK